MFQKLNAMVKLQHVVESTFSMRGHDNNLFCLIYHKSIFSMKEAGPLMTKNTRKIAQNYSLLLIKSLYTLSLSDYSKKGDVRKRTSLCYSPA